ncbi:hypothetical protein [Paludibacterium purpuratum]|uniref:Lipoprotein n=1 Tax=Paludibacterium purpuratum TaxID=1144873 RepID=A0A4R7AVN5_9NEIS|nr:hypothetical protein [Paludibacterium purpuratum]TDR70236.1 hypothetical protein DFP86_1265 [Paludibacterium purpuratum]
MRHCKKISASIFSIATSLTLSACGSIHVSKTYPGVELPANQVAVYSPFNRGDFSGPSISTQALNGKPLGEYFPNSPFGPYISFLPGDVTVRISFVDYDDVFASILLPNLAQMKVKNFVGYYDLKFTAKPGKFYAPIFNYNLPHDKRLTEMCISELPLDSSLSETRMPQHYVACAAPSLPPTEDNIKICAAINTSNNKTTIYNQMCQGIISGNTK